MILIQAHGYADFAKVAEALFGPRRVFYSTEGSTADFQAYAVCEEIIVILNPGTVGGSVPGSFLTDFPDAIELANRLAFWTTNVTSGTQSAW